jgi:DNA polymerase/3'-5' exonuclease PolX
VLPPAQWGALFAVRTGPADFSQRLVTVCKHRGVDMRDGRLVARGSGRDVATPEERDFFQACGLAYLEPWERR